jgi:carbamate kinase
MRRILSIIGIPTLTIIIIGIVVILNVNKVKTIKIDDNLLVLEGGGGNSFVLTSDEGSEALIVDTKVAFAAKYLASQVKASDE